MQVEDEGEMGIPVERFVEVFDLMRSGNRSFRAGRFEEVRGQKMKKKKKK